MPTDGQAKHSMIRGVWLILEHIIFLRHLESDGPAGKPWENINFCFPDNLQFKAD